MKYIASIFTILGFSACSIKEPVKVFEPYEGPLVEIHNVESLFSDSSVVRVRLRAPLQYELQNKDREFPEGIEIEFFDGNKEVESTLVANYAKFDAETSIYNVKGNVIINNIDKGEKLESENLFWNPDTEEISAPDDVQVRVQTAEEVLVGKGLVAKQDFTEYKILNPTGVFSIDN